MYVYLRYMHFTYYQFHSNYFLKILWFSYRKTWNSQMVVFFTSNASIIWAPSSEFVSSSIPSWQILTAHAQTFRWVRDLAFCLKVPLDSLLVWASSQGSGENAQMRRLAWTFAARIGDKYQIRLTRSIYLDSSSIWSHISPNSSWSLFLLLFFWRLCNFNLKI